MRALSNLTPNCGAHAHGPQTSAAECACWGQSQPGHGEGMWDQPFAYIKGAAQPMASYLQLRGEMGSEKQSLTSGFKVTAMSSCPPVIRTARLD